MLKGQVAQKGPYKIDVEAGKVYFWCACGRSQNQPFCDGSHEVTDLRPVRWKAEEAGTKFFCGCKQTDGRPFCHGTHKTL
jgi:CDGSH-type Zn-finger protein